MYDIVKMKPEQIMLEKRMSGEAAADYVKDGMVIGLGTGSTVYYTILKIGQMVREGLKIKAVSTSSGTSRLSKELGIPLVDLSEVEQIDVTIDGADEVDPCLRGIKGGGGALLFEKIVASCSRKNLWVIDSTKYVKRLGKFKLPVEVIPMAASHIQKRLELNGYDGILRTVNGKPYLTDSGNRIIDMDISKTTEYQKLNQWLLGMPGVVETGLFLDVADIILRPVENQIEVMKR